MDLIAVAIAICLAIVALIHSLWAFGGTWPASNEAELSAMVVGTKGETHMPKPWLTGCVAIGIFAAAAWPLFWRGLLPYPHIVPQTVIWLGMWALTLVFIGRGAASYLPLSMDMEQRFLRLNRLYFSPLILAIGIGFLLLTLDPL